MEQTNSPSHNAIINQITLDCLMKKEHKQNPIQLAKPFHKKDKKFYRKRILALTKEMLLNNYPESLLPDVKKSFDNYVSTCISYLQTIDETDIIQEDYKEINKYLDEKTNRFTTYTETTTLQEDANKLMMRSIQIKKNQLDSFVKIKQTKEINPPIIPLQKEINLQDPQLKNKGIRKKKNITNNYEEQNKKESNTET